MEPEWAAESQMIYRARHGTEKQWILSERQPDVYDPASMVTPNLILPLLIDPKFNSKSSIAYLIYGFYGRLHEEGGRAFVAQRAKVFLNFWKYLCSLKIFLFPSQLPLPLSISLNTPPPSPKSFSSDSSLQAALSNPHQYPACQTKA